MTNTPKQRIEIIKVENADPSNEAIWIQQYPLLVDKTTDELATLNKSVLKKLDWKFLPCISIMLLMKYGSPPTSMNTMLIRGQLSR